MSEAMQPDGPNAEQIEFWNGPAGGKWVVYQERQDETLRPLGYAAMERADIAEGEAVLDVGCGCGDTSFDIARRVGASGSVRGIDISSVMLAHARARAEAEPDLVVEFENADAETHALPAEAFDLVYSRFGVMFFRNPQVAFANLCSSLKPGGRIAFVCWRTLKENQWFSLPLAIAAQHIELPDPTPPGEPGPFAFADPENLRGILDAAGFADIAIEANDQPIPVGGAADLDDIVEFIMQQGPMGRALTAVEADDETRGRVAAGVRAAFAPHFADGMVRLGTATWMVTARRS
jgi:SAM-dependent methyltransferase